MGVEVKGAGDGVVIADRGCNDCNYGRNNSGWGSGWGAVIENTAKDQEIAHLNRVVDAQRDQNIINQVVAALKGTTTPAQ